MTCRDIESLILAERDGALTPTERAALSDHVAACPACARLRTNLAAALDAFKASSAAVRVPDVDEAWRDLRAKLHEPARPAKKRPLAPVIWFGAPLTAAAAALAFLFLFNPAPKPLGEMPVSIASAAAVSPPPPPPPPPYEDPSLIAGADFVEVGDPNASTMVYVDKDSGWLVVWATDASDDGTTRG